MRQIMDRNCSIKWQIHYDIFVETLWFIHLRWMDVVTICIGGYACFVDILRTNSIVILTCIYFVGAIYLTMLQWRIYKYNCLRSHIIPELLLIVDGKYRRMHLPLGPNQCSKMEKLFVNMYKIIYFTGNGVDILLQRTSKVFNKDIHNVIIEYLWSDIGGDDFSINECVHRYNISFY